MYAYQKVKNRILIIKNKITVRGSVRGINAGMEEVCIRLCYVYAVDM